MIYQITIEESPASNNRPGIYVKLEGFNGIIDIEELFKIKENGFYPLFTCECGEFYCSGYYVYIEIREDKWIVNNKYSPESKELIEEFSISLQKDFIKNLKKEIAKKIKNFSNNYPNSELFIGTYSHNINDKNYHLYKNLLEYEKQ